ncbi:hypothetical protein F511_39681 [Dorcoceras hygrometricum]|uniref:Uncharacterized protein n=1 Tax=Dorcoceras hygrometricum TaxID=472368 RepID=A0A2Z7CWF7_9LAMI|nr:hypothetical protein F511_39681 [Dorcoceras hygrometricum]
MLPAKDMQYTFDVSKSDEIFDDLMKEKFITFPPDHKAPSREETKGRDYCKYHDSYNHTTKSCCAFKNMLQERINKGVLKFLEKQNSMAVDEDPFPPVASINMNIDLREFLNEKRAMNEKRVRVYWIPKGQMFEAHKNYGGSTTKHVSRGSPGNIGESTANWPRNQYFPKKMRETHHSDDMNRRIQREIQKEGNYRPRLLPKNTLKEHDCLKKNEPKGKAREAKVAEHHNRSRFILLSSNEVDNIWKLVRHKKSHKSLTRTQKMLREGATAKRELTGAVVSKSKFCRKVTEDKSSDDLSSEDDIQGNKTIDFHVGKFHISVDCNTGVVIWPEKFRLDVDEEETVNHGSKKEEDPVPTGVCVSAFTGESTKTIRVFLANVTVGSLSSLYVFLLANASANVQALLEKNWIHTNQSIPSSMHQLLLFWKEDEVEIIEADVQPFQANTSTVEARYYNGDFGPIIIRSSNTEELKAVYTESLAPSPILDKILKPTVIVPYRPVIHPIVEEIDD